MVDIVELLGYNYCNIVTSQYVTRVKQGLV